MTKTYVYEPNGLRPTVVDTDDSGELAGKEIYVYSKTSQRPVRVTIENALGNLNELGYIYSFDVGDDRELRTSRGKINSSALVNPYVFVFDTSLTDGNEVTLPQLTNSAFLVQWGDGTEESVTSTSGLSHVYDAEGEYAVKIYPDESGSANIAITGFSDNMTEVRQWASLTPNSITRLDEIPNLVFFNKTFPANTNIRNVLQNSPPPSYADNFDFSAEGISFFIIGPNGVGYSSGLMSALSTWDVSGVVDMSFAFRQNDSMDADISSWDTSAVSNMRDMFQDAENFNYSIGLWDTSNVSDMTSMFAGARAFDQDISSWDVSNVTGMSSMFNQASAFNKNLGSWDIDSTADIRDMFANSAMSPENLARTFIGWANYVFENGKPLNLNVGSTVGLIAAIDIYEDITGEFNSYPPAAAYLESQGWVLGIEQVAPLVGTFASNADFSANTTLTKSNTNVDDRIIIGDLTFNVTHPESGATETTIPGVIIFLINDSVDPIGAAYLF